MTGGSRTLNEPKPTLPTSWYTDAAHYERELEAIWYRDWVCIGRDEDVAQPGDYRLVTIGRQEVILTRGDDGALHAFHNSCRHRGAALCREERGRFRKGRIVCPYHAWTYSTEGELLATPRRLEGGTLDRSQFGLYEVAVDSWRGFVFVNLADRPDSTLPEFLGDEAANLARWPLEDLRTVHRETHRLACNWKIFWENYNECYHCPTVHPELCRVMPVYRKAVFDDADLPEWQPRHEGDLGRGRVGDGAQSWTTDGQIAFPVLPGLSGDDIAAGITFATFTASMFIAAHPEYVRSVRLFPTGPESCELVVDWLLLESTVVGSPDDLAPILDFARTVIREDGEICELNQRGLRSRRHERGVLVAQEYELWNFHEWLRGRLGEQPG